MVDRRHGSPASAKFFTEAFEGVLITDLLSLCDAAVCAEKQEYWTHLLRDAAAVQECLQFSKCIFASIDALDAAKTRWQSRQLAQ